MPHLHPMGNNKNLYIRLKFGKNIKYISYNNTFFVKSEGKQNTEKSEQSLCQVHLNSFVCVQGWWVGGP